MLCLSLIKQIATKGETPDTCVLMFFSPMARRWDQSVKEGEENGNAARFNEYMAQVFRLLAWYEYWTCVRTRIRPFVLVGIFALRKRLWKMCECSYACASKSCSTAGKGVFPHVSSLRSRPVCCVWTRRSSLSSLLSPSDATHTHTHTWLYFSPSINFIMCGLSTHSTVCAATAIYF